MKEKISRVSLGLNPQFNNFTQLVSFTSSNYCWVNSNLAEIFLFKMYCFCYKLHRITAPCYLSQETMTNRQTLTHSACYMTVIHHSLTLEFIDPSNGNHFCICTTQTNMKHDHFGPVKHSRLFQPREHVKTVNLCYSNLLSATIFKPRDFYFRFNPVQSFYYINLIYCYNYYHALMWNNV